jgi:hypothetical protein
MQLHMNCLQIPEILFTDPLQANSYGHQSREEARKYTDKLRASKAEYRREFEASRPCAMRLESVYETADPNHCEARVGHIPERPESDYAIQKLSAMRLEPSNKIPGQNYCETELEHIPELQIPPILTEEPLDPDSYEYVWRERTGKYAARLKADQEKYQREFEDRQQTHLFAEQPFLSDTKYYEAEHEHIPEKPEDEPVIYRHGIEQYNQDRISPAVSKAISIMRHGLRIPERRRIVFLVLSTTQSQAIIMDSHPKVSWGLPTMHSPAGIPASHKRAFLDLSTTQSQLLSIRHLQIVFQVISTTREDQ